MDLFQPRRPGVITSARHDQRPSVSRIFDELLIGEYPRPEDIGWLRQKHGVSAIHSLQDNEDLQVKGLDIRVLEQTCQEHAIKLVRTPIPDGSADALATHLARALAELSGLIAKGEVVYLHCNAGMNRAPTLAIAYAHACRDMTLNEAMRWVKQRRPCGPFMSVLEEYFGSRDRKYAK